MMLTPRAIVTAEGATVDVQHFVLDNSTDWWQVVAAAGTALAAGFAGVAAFSARKAARTTAALVAIESERREEEREERLTADVVGTFIRRRRPDASFDDDYLQVVNRGPAWAENVRCEWADGAGSNLLGDIPVRLPPNERFEMQYVITLVSTDPHLVLVWTDSRDGQGGERRYEVPWLIRPA